VVPASAEQPKTATVAADWRLHGEAALAAAKWPVAPRFEFKESASTVAPNVADLSVTNPTGAPIAAPTSDAPRLRTRTPLPPEFIWPRQLSSMPGAFVVALPVPSAELFRASYGLLEGGFAPHHADTAHRAEITRSAAD
jgi:hypothetical protein